MSSTAGPDPVPSLLAAGLAGLGWSVSEYVRDHFWITASGMLDPALLDQVRTGTTPDQLVFSTDYPFQEPTREE